MPPQPWGGGIKRWWPLSVRLSVCPTSDLSRKWKGIGSWKLAYEVVKRLPGTWKCWRHTACVFYRDVNVQWTISVYGPQAESSMRLFKSSLARGRGILWHPHPRLHSLLLLLRQTFTRCTLSILEDESEAVHRFARFYTVITLRAKPSGAVYCYRSCLCVCLQRAGGRCLLPR